MEVIIKDAEQLILDLKSFKKDITITQIRKFLTNINSINNKVLAYESQSGEGKDLATLPLDIANEIRYLEVKLRYQCGREKNVKEFAEKGNLFVRIQAIGNDAKKYKDFAKFIEAIVAFHKFHGGKD